MKQVKLIICFLALIAIVNSNTPTMFGQEFTIYADEELNVQDQFDNKFLGFLEDLVPITPVVEPSTSVAEPSTSVPEPSTSVATPSTMDNIISAFTKVTNQWAKVVDAFKTTRSETLKKKLLGKGFDAFSQAAQIQISKGVKAVYLDQFLLHLSIRLKVPSERQNDLKMVLEEVKFAGETVWSCFNTIFAVDNGGNTKFASILVGRNDANDTYDFVFTDINATFMLAPDTMVINKSLSVAGGIWSDSKDHYVRVNKSLTQDDVATVLSFFQIVAFKGFADQFGIKLNFPIMDHK